MTREELGNLKWVLHMFRLWIKADMISNEIEYSTLLENCRAAELAVNKELKRRKKK